MIPASCRPPARITASTETINSSGMDSQIAWGDARRAAMAFQVGSSEASQSIVRRPHPETYLIIPRLPSRTRENLVPINQTARPSSERGPGRKGQRAASGTPNELSSRSGAGRRSGGRNKGADHRNGAGRRTGDRNKGAGRRNGAGHRTGDRSHSTAHSETVAGAASLWRARAGPIGAAEAPWGAVAAKPRASNAASTSFLSTFSTPWNLSRVDTPCPLDREARM